MVPIEKARKSKKMLARNGYEFVFVSKQSAQWDRNEIGAVNWFWALNKDKKLGSFFATDEYLICSKYGLFIVIY